MAIMRCPTCDDALYIANNVRVGQIITCDSCEELLTVTSIQPIMLQICDENQDSEEECIQVPVRNTSTKSKKKSMITTFTKSDVDEDVEEYQEERKLEKKRRRQPNHQKLEFFDE